VLSTEAIEIAGLVEDLDGDVAGGRGIELHLQAADRSIGVARENAARDGRLDPGARHLHVGLVGEPALAEGNGEVHALRAAHARLRLEPHGDLRGGHRIAREDGQLFRALGHDLFLSVFAGAATQGEGSERHRQNHVSDLHGAGR
jgi:hypothetical protein